MAETSVRVLGIDTALRTTGFAVIEAQGSRVRAVEYGLIRRGAQAPHSECLCHLAQGLNDVIVRAAPTEVAIEGIFFCKNVKTAVVLGEARGVAIATCAAHALPVYELAPRRIKQAVVGYGAADKEQVRRMVMTILGLDRAPEEDSSDALAIAIAHLHQRSTVSALAPKPL
jgi:crossover junction endodeoxyribonuclease RuvC